ncbi:unnamed protein product [Prorocentrum cordatum]|uniref:Uncharacterized protein n=1 Tax=Prorocentrum cordatum TaxID=2364126 RepID=A0ABN9RE68_9DINO|nr:unnamed protein product [Polarella glacialis]
MRIFMATATHIVAAFPDWCHGQVADDGSEDKAWDPGDKVRYWSTTVKDWIAAKVQKRNKDGTYDLNCKKNVKADRIVHATGKAGADKAAKKRSPSPSEASQRKSSKRRKEGKGRRSPKKQVSEDESSGNRRKKGAKRDGKKSDLKASRTKSVVKEKKEKKENNDVKKDAKKDRRDKRKKSEGGDGQKKSEGAEKGQRSEEADEAEGEKGAGGRGGAREERAEQQKGPVCADGDGADSPRGDDGHKAAAEGAAAGAAGERGAPPAAAQAPAEAEEPVTPAPPQGAAAGGGAERPAEAEPPQEEAQAAAAAAEAAPRPAAPAVEELSDGGEAAAEASASDAEMVVPTPGRARRLALGSGVLVGSVGEGAAGKSREQTAGAPGGSGGRAWSEHSAGQGQDLGRVWGGRERKQTMCHAKRAALRFRATDLLREQPRLRRHRDVPLQPSWTACHRGLLQEFLVRRVRALHARPTICQVEEGKKTVIVAFEGNESVWKSVPFSMLGRKDCPLQPGPDGAGDAPKAADKKGGGTGGGAARRPNRERSRSKTPDWQDLEKQRRQREMEEAMKQQEEEQKRPVWGKKELQEQERIMEEKRRKELMELEKRKVQEAFERRKKEAEEQKLREEEAAAGRICSMHEFTSVLTMSLSGFFS